ncbi:hypothetical protein MRX96_022949 [Rhipicephalus microplus]
MPRPTKQRVVEGNSSTISLAETRKKTRLRRAHGSSFVALPPRGDTIRYRVSPWRLSGGLNGRKLAPVAAPRTRWDPTTADGAHENEEARRTSNKPAAHRLKRKRGLRGGDFLAPGFCQVALLAGGPPQNPLLGSE